MEDELGEKLTEFVALILKTCSYLLACGSGENKEAKTTKMYVIKRKLKFEEYNSNHQ